MLRVPKGAARQPLHPQYGSTEEMAALIEQLQVKPGAFISLFGGKYWEVLTRWQDEGPSPAWKRSCPHFMNPRSQPLLCAPPLTAGPTGGEGS